MPEGRGRKRKRLSIEPNASQKADICRNKGLPKGHADKKTNHQLSLQYGCHPDSFKRIVREGKGPSGNRDPVLYYEFLATYGDDRCRKQGGGRKMSEVNQKVYPKLQKLYEKKKAKGDAISSKSDYT